MTVSWTDVVSAFSSTVTAVGVCLAWRSLRATRDIARVQFEDSLSREYRELMSSLPIGALLGQTLDEVEAADHLGRFYRYLDLCNEQAFLFQRKRVSESTWNEWLEGIRTNLQMPAFSAARNAISVAQPDRFQELRSCVPPFRPKVAE